MVDPLEQTHPPQQFRCDAHEAFTMAVESRLTRVETRLDNVDKSIEKLDATIRTGVNEIKGQLVDYHKRNLSQDVHIVELTAEQKSRQLLGDRVVMVIKLLVPIVVAAVTAIGGTAWMISCSG